MGRKKDRESSDEVSPPGLKNLGNTCYFNSVLQALCASSIKVPEEGAAEEAGAELAATITTMRSQRGTVVPNALLSVFAAKRSQFKVGQQHDAHELLRQLLDLTKAEDAFRGWLCGMTKCGKCGGISPKLDPILDLTVAVPIGGRKGGRGEPQESKKDWKSKKDREKEEKKGKEKDKAAKASRLDELVERYPDLQDAEHEELKKEMKNLDKKAKQKVKSALAQKDKAAKRDVKKGKQRATAPKKREEGAKDTNAESNGETDANETDGGEEV